MVNFARRVLKKDANAIGAMRVLVLYLLTREGKATVASTRITEISEAISKQEPKNAKLYYDVSRLCARLAARQPK